MEKINYGYSSGYGDGDNLHALNLNVNELRRQTEDDFLKVNRRIDQYIAMHKDHYANHEQLKKEMQLIVNAQDDTADHGERIGMLESGTREKFKATAEDLERIFEILQEHRIATQNLESKSPPEPSNSPLQSVYVVMDLESRQPHAHRVFACIQDARVYCCSQVANYSLVEMEVVGTPNNPVPQ